MANGKHKIVLSVGGSLLVPNGGVSVDFLKSLNTFVRAELAEDPTRQFFLVVGGGTIARQYRDVGREVVGHELTADDLDWLGIHATKLNAHLVRTIFRDIAHPVILRHYETIQKAEEPVVIGSGWKPGWSTDFCAALVCEDYGAREIINLSNVDQVYDANPKTNPNAKPVDKMTWDELRAMIGDKWSPGMNTPFDPVAAKKCQEIGVKVVVMNGNNFENLEKVFASKCYQNEGTVEQNGDEKQK